VYNYQQEIHNLERDMTMRNDVVLLKLYLDALNVPHNIEKIDERKQVQKAIYLAQRFTGLDLGYRYGWYILGPYSSSLADDYYALHREIESGSKDFEEYELPSKWAKILKHLRKKIEMPSQFALDFVDWIELLASVDFLTNVSKYSNDQAKEVLKKQKPHLFEHYNLAISKLGEIGLPVV
jgi:uncharacterized protein YwgA